LNTITDGAIGYAKILDAQNTFTYKNVCNHFSARSVNMTREEITRIAAAYAALMASMAAVISAALWV
jgi:hypothetical protein